MISRGHSDEGTSHAFDFLGAQCRRIELRGVDDGFCEYILLVGVGVGRTAIPIPRSNFMKLCVFGMF